MSNPEENNNFANSCTTEVISPSDKFAEDGVKYILKNDLKNGLKCLEEALKLNSSDHRHYLNRSYCYLRMEEYELALDDAFYVKERAVDEEHLFLAYLRAGQALYALKNYLLAEIILNVAVELKPENVYSQRELMRVKVSQIENMGYSKRDALLSLEKHSTVSEAVQYLTETQAKLQDHSKTEDQLKNDCDDVKFVYYSDKDETPNNVEIMNRILKHKFDEIKGISKYQ